MVKVVVVEVVEVDEVDEVVEVDEAVTGLMRGRPGIWTQLRM